MNDFTQDQITEATDLALAILESDSGASASYFRDMIGWERAGTTAAYGSSEINRTDTVKRARTDVIHDPLCRQIVSLYTTFTFGRGITVSIPGGEDSSKKATTALKDFWYAPINRRTLGFKGQITSASRMSVDGEIMFGLFEPEVGQQYGIRRMDPLQITEILTDPDDAETPWWYKREFASRKGKHQIYYYRDINAPDRIELPANAPAGEEREGEWIYHATRDEFGQRGNSLLLTVMDWAKAHRRFMTDRMAIQRSLAIYAWREKLKKGGPSVLASRVAATQSGHVTGDSETNPPPAPGSVRHETAGVDFEQLKTDTGAANAQKDGAQLLQIVGAAAGIFPHYFGAGESFRLATATAMELPMLKLFESYQQLWEDIYQDIIHWVFVRAGVPEDEMLVDIDFPNIVLRDVPKLLDSIGTLIQKVPKLAESEDILRLLIILLGMDNAQEILDSIPTHGTTEEVARNLVEAIGAFEKQVKANGTRSLTSV